MPSLEYLSLILVALGLSADCFAVAISTSIARRNLSPFHIGRVALTFGSFHTIMPALGWLAGLTIVEFIGGFDHWLAFALLGFVGAKMVWGALRDEDAKGDKSDITNITMILPLMIMGIATSIDALAVGFSFAFLKTSLVLSCIIVGVVVGAVALAGFIVGRKVGVVVGKRAEVVGGLILVGIGTKVVVEHLA